MTRTLVPHILCPCGTAYIADGDVGKRLRALGATATADHHPPVEEEATPPAERAGWRRTADGWVCPRHAPATATAPADAPEPGRLTQP